MPAASCSIAALWRVPAMIALDLFRVCSSSDRARADVIARDLRRAGLAAVFLPSDRAIGVWDVEVAADDLALARALVESAEAH
jgi:hypothetical protein